MSPIQQNKKGLQLTTWVRYNSSSRGETWRNNSVEGENGASEKKFTASWTNPVTLMKNLKHTIKGALH